MLFQCWILYNEGKDTINCCEITSKKRVLIPSLKYLLCYSKKMAEVVVFVSCAGARMVTWRDLNQSASVTLMYLIHRGLITVVLLIWLIFIRLIDYSLLREHYNRCNIQYATLATIVDTSVHVKSIFLSLFGTSLPGCALLNDSARLETVAA
jgi:hypothetical protein